MHRMFTNIEKYDEDIQHQYKVYLYQFLYLKWRFDSLISAIASRNYVKLALCRSTLRVLFSITSVLLCGRGTCFVGSLENSLPGFTLQSYWSATTRGKNDTLRSQTCPLSITSCSPAAITERTACFGFCWWEECSSKLSITSSLKSLSTDCRRRN